MSSAAAKLASLLSPRGQAVALALLGLVGTGALLAALYQVFGVSERQQAVDGWRVRLEATAADRASAVDRFLSIALADAATLAEYPSVVERLCGGASQPPHASHLERILEITRERKQYRGVWLLDARGREVLGTPGALTPPSAAEGQATLGVTKDGSVALFLRAAVGASEAPCGSVVMERDPESSLYPILASQGAPTRSAETLLIAKEGETALFLSPLRFRADPPLTLRLPLSRPRFGASAALAGSDVSGEFVDYRDEPILAATHRLRSAPWALLAKVDLEEALGSYREKLARTLPVLGAVVLALAAAGFGQWRFKRAQYETRLAEGQADFALAQQAKISETKKLWRAVEQSPVSIVITDAQGAIEYVNPRFTQVTGYGHEEALGKTPRILKSGRTPESVYSDLWATISSGREWRGEMCNRRKDGTLFWEAASISPVLDAEGRTTHYVAVKEDISARVHADEERRSLEDQLRQSQKMEAIGRLAGGVAHDFNNLLAVITGYSEMMARRLAEASPERRHAGEILKAATRAAGLTRQLLAFSRKQILEPKVLDLNAVVIDVEKMLQRIIGEDVRLRTSLASDVWPLLADPGQLEQVLLNLAVNARDAMPEGGSLTIETANATLLPSQSERLVGLRAGDYVRLAVSDTGCGIAPEIRDRIFEPFFTTKEQGKGTGLGLATVYGVVQQSGGHISVDSEVGKGTRFTILLPRAASTPATAPEASSLGAERGDETILLVEDEEMLRAATEEALSDAGYRVLSAPGTAEALRLAAGHPGPIHLLLTDVVMPGAPGPELARLLAAERPETRVLFVTGYPEPGGLKASHLEAGAALLQKPYGIAALLAAVRRQLAG
jgi:PAS domain S-box-containing protein